MLIFGLPRSLMPTAGIFAARAAYIAGFDGTSDVEAGRRFAMPVYGTMAHSFVMVFDSEAEAFRAFAETFPRNTMLLIPEVRQDCRPPGPSRPAGPGRSAGQRRYPPTGAGRPKNSGSGRSAAGSDLRKQRR